MDIPIHSVGSRKVIFDSDLARLYEVTTKRLNEQVKRNERKFPESFRFQLTQEQFEALRSQNATSNKGSGGDASCRSGALGRAQRGRIAATRAREGSLVKAEQRGAVRPRGQPASVWVAGEGPRVLHWGAAWRGATLERLVCIYSVDTAANHSNVRRPRARGTLAVSRAKDVPASEDVGPVRHFERVGSGSGILPAGRDRSVNRGRPITPAIPRPLPLICPKCAQSRMHYLYLDPQTSERSERRMEKGAK